ncbi:MULTISPECIES: YgfZ/GcvT domain-containing protein [Halocynthiibacter]|uniref:Folate-binding protein n=1 Tax=Halocynthiibacter halioticoli TaxID=2986804 RepID=A0AAE3J3R9_9RHOB|nr:MULTISPECIES: folate-binding protein [Halocynthiibacter]MCV6825002.1 folate-binding protein [Halocynthiibacter halioticoli]MCW4058003.1 folate-binding protein [Halocynthiibacter sp. SDUM655004]
MSSDTRNVLKISGKDRVEFLQGLVTNDVIKGGLIYTALLTPQGKYLADFFLLDTGEEFLVDVDSSLTASLVQRLNMYKLRADVAIEETSLRVSNGLGETPDGAHADPRHPQLGWRSYGESDDTMDLTALRVAHTIPQSGVELTPDTYILEAGFERLNGVDFKKGCYVGQEVTARMKHKTKLRKGLVTVEISGAAPIGTEITNAGKPAGTLYSQAGTQAIAYLRFDRAKGDLNAGDARITANL